jgi:hypothetical protein
VVVGRKVANAALGDERCAKQEMENDESIAVSLAMRN